MTHLMQPRYKVIADWPGSFYYKVGQILLCTDELIKERGAMATPTELDKYPHLFLLLEWWKDLRLEEMPQYVKRGNKVFKTDLTFKTTYRVGLVYLDGRDEAGRKNFIWLHSCLPATLEEYTNYQTRPGGVK